MHSRLSKTLLFLLLSCGYVFSLPGSPCPCPGKWWPPFRASQLIYSEFPEDRARSLNINRRESNSIVEPEDKPQSLPPQARNYPDYESSSKEFSPEYFDESNEYYKYNGYNDYKEDKEEDPYDFTLESFELDPEVMNPPPPPEEDESRENSTTSEETEVHESTDPPTTQLEVPATEVPLESKTVQPPPPPPQIKVGGYPLTRTPVPTFRNPALPQGTKPWPGMDRWRSVLAERELSSLQFMKPPPLGQAQTWARSPPRFRPRPTVIYL